MLFMLLFVVGVVVGTHYLETTTLAMLLFTISLFQIIYIKIRSLSKEEYIVPVFALFVSLSVWMLDDVAIFKLLPVALSALFFLKFLNAYLYKKPFLANMLRVIPRLKLSDEKLMWIDNSHLYWAAVNAINLILQIAVLAAPLKIWALYTTVGWYLLFSIALVAQIIYIRRRLRC